MNIFDSIFGSARNLTSQDHAADAAQYSYQAQAQQQAARSQAQQQAFQNKMNSWNTNPYAQRNWVSHRWVFAGQPCSLQEFADHIWGPGEHEDKMLFLLTHSGPQNT